jgi:catechol 2,3-dioxygenase-like lactoylglutathione lyase family enzyme
MDAPMLDHISLGVSNLAGSRRFYDAALRPLGIVRLLDFESRGSDYGAMAAPLGVEFTITQEDGATPSVGLHLCFRAPDQKAVEEFHTAALHEGGRDDGKPRLRARYHEDYFAAFVLDPDGHRIEAVCHAPAEPIDSNDSNAK